jgi:hypothetical protein
MRKLAIFAIAVAMIVGAGYLLFEEFTAARIVDFKFVFAAGVLVALGFMLLWEDFISPMAFWSKKTANENPWRASDIRTFTPSNATTESLQKAASSFVKLIGDDPNPNEVQASGFALAGLAGFLVGFAAAKVGASYEEYLRWCREGFEKSAQDGYQGHKRENPFRALDSDAFDKGETINRCASKLRCLAMSQTSTSSDAIIALQTALGNEIAATALRGNPNFLPDQKLYKLDQMLDAIGPGVREAAYIAADLPSPPQNEEGRDLTGDEFTGLTTRILNEATKNNTRVNDGITATAKAIGIMISILAERSGVSASAEELIKFSQDAVAEYARAAVDFVASQKTR